MYQKIEKLVAMQVDQYKWFARRAANAAGAYLYTYQNDTRHCIQVGREPNETDSNGIAIAVLLDYLHPLSLVEFDLRAGQGLLTPDREVLIELIPVGEKYKLTDPFMLGQGVGKATTYRVRATDCWKNLIIKPIGITGHAILRIRIPYGVPSTPRFADFIEISQLRVTDRCPLYVTDLIYKNIPQEIVFPDVRYICNKPSERLVVTFASINFPSGKYSTYSTFDGIDANRLILNDSRSQWYKDGIEGFGGNIEELRQKLLDLIKKIDAKKTVFYGMSMGGYGAILFGYWLNATRIIAINPETKLMEEGARSAQYIQGVHPEKDLMEALESYKGSLKLFFSKSDPVDKKSLAYIRGKSIKADLYLVSSSHNMPESMQHYYWLKALIEHMDASFSDFFQKDEI